MPEFQIKFKPNLTMCYSAGPVLKHKAGKQEGRFSSFMETNYPANISLSTTEVNTQLSVKAATGEAEDLRGSQGISQVKGEVWKP